MNDTITVMKHEMLLTDSLKVNVDWKCNSNQGNHNFIWMSKSILKVMWKVNKKKFNINSWI